MVTFALCFGALGLFAAICGFAFGPGKGTAVLVAALILFGGIVFFTAPIDFGRHFLFLDYGIMIVGLASGLGLGAGTQLKAKNYWLAAFLFLPFPVLIWKTQFSESAVAEGKELALQFVKAEVGQFSGGPYSISLSSITTSNSWHFSPGRYEFYLSGANPFSLIVDARREWGGTKFTIACATRLSSGYRDSFKDPCLQSPMPLPK